MKMPESALRFVSRLSPRTRSAYRHFRSRHFLGRSSLSSALPIETSQVVFTGSRAQESTSALRFCSHPGGFSCTRCRVLSSVSAAMVLVPSFRVSPRICPTIFCGCRRFGSNSSVDNENAFAFSSSHEKTLVRQFSSLAFRGGLPYIPSVRRASLRVSSHGFSTGWSPLPSSPAGGSLEGQTSRESSRELPRSARRAALLALATGALWVSLCDCENTVRRLDKIWIGARGGRRHERVEQRQEETGERELGAVPLFSSSLHPQTDSRPAAWCQEKPASEETKSLAKSGETSAIDAQRETQPPKPRTRPFVITKEKYLEKKFAKSSEYRRTESGMRICEKEEGRGERVVGPGDVVWLQYEARRASDDQIFESTYAARLPTFLLKLFYLLGKRDIGSDAMPDGPYVRARVSCGDVCSSPPSSSVLLGECSAVELKSPLQRTERGFNSNLQNLHKSRVNGEKAESDTSVAGQTSRRKDREDGGSAAPCSPQAGHNVPALQLEQKSGAGKERSDIVSVEKGFHPLIPALDEGIRGMRVGGIRELIVPPYLAYPFMCQEVLVYEVHVLWIGETLPKSDSLWIRLKRVGDVLWKSTGKGEEPKVP
ncbi:peptidyl-prolyl cis-trans isomerase, FKBP-type domain-containing protein [Toxoplasma gondii MAS]|uniref:peptidylprolyl isomerase n=1 Tax=Toxoplasma gondii MAS TaxID=943118 RepID=A0A086QKZ4_TOXGO|nr:peptidyl-prolyl cis-trans isomerase, FKBP-type domain-containing protein [Toxoplasma gondii MAS]